MKADVSSRPQIALVTNSPVGGLNTMTQFLFRVLSESGRYCPEIITLATSASDEASILFRAPHTWLSSPRVLNLSTGDATHYHVGAYWPEFEFQRHRPRAVLDKALAQYGLIQFVVGAPYWARAAAGVKRPTLLWTATTVWADKASRMLQAPLLIETWQRLMTRIQQRAEKRALNQVDHIFALSQYTAETIKPWAPGASIDVAVCGVDTTLFEPAPQPSGNYAICVGRLSDRRKNLQLLLAAYAKAVAGSALIPELYLVGDLPTGIERQVVSLGIAERVRFLGERHGKELADLYRNAQFLVLSSDEEGLGIVLLEAMASGLPVISTSCGGPATVVADGQTGFLTPVGDANRLANAIRQLAENPELRRQMGRAGRSAVERRFSLEVTGKVFLDKYDQLLNSTTQPDDSSKNSEPPRDQGH